MFQLIESANLNGGNRQVVAEKVAHPYNIALYQDRVFWTDWQKTSVYSVRKDGSKPQDHDLVLPKLAGVMDIHAVEMDQRGGVLVRGYRSCVYCVLTL